MFRILSSILSPYALGASLRTQGMTPLPNPPLGVPGVSDYQGLVRLVGEPAAGGFVRLFGSASAPWPFWPGMEERGSYLVVTELKGEMAKARAGARIQCPVANYLRTNASKEQREATIEIGLRAMLERRGIEVGTHAEEAIEQEIALVSAWIDDPKRFFPQTPSAAAILEAVMARFPEAPDPDKIEDLEGAIVDYFAESLKAEFGLSERVQQKAWDAFQKPMVIVSDLFPGAPRNCAGLSMVHFLGGEIGLLSNYGLIMELFVRFHEAIHVGDLYPVELGDWVVAGLTLGLLKGTKSFSKVRQMLSAASEQKARYYDWQLAQRFFRGHEELILHQGLSLQLEPEVDDIPRASLVVDTYFQELMAAANTSLFDYLLGSLIGYEHLGIIKDPERPQERRKRHKTGDRPITEGRTFMASPEAAGHLRDVLTPGAEVMYVTFDRSGRPHYTTFKVPPR